MAQIVDYKNNAKSQQSSHDISVNVLRVRALPQGFLASVLHVCSGDVRATPLIPLVLV